MSVLNWIRGLFDVSSKRGDVDYSKELSDSAKFGVLLLFRDLNYDREYYSNSGPDEYWMNDVVREMGHLNHSFAGAVNRVDSFQAIVDFLEQERSTVVFLDFLELSLRHWRAPNHDNEFVDAINSVLEVHNSSYAFTRFSYEITVQEIDNTETKEIVAYPKPYLKQHAIVQSYAIEPALDVFSVPGYKIPANDFRKALSKYRNGDYDGCVTSCASAVEGTIKVAAATNGWKIKSSGLDNLAQSFISKSILPESIRKSFRVLSDWRNMESDSHGHAEKQPTTEAIARHFIAVAASLIVLVQSESK